MMVGTKAIATLSTGYLNALAFANALQFKAWAVQSDDPVAALETLNRRCVGPHRDGVGRIALGEQRGGATLGARAP